MSKLKGAIISQNRINNETELYDFLKRYNGESFNSNFEDWFNPDYQFDYCLLFDTDTKCIINKQEEQCNSSLISEINFDKCISYIVNDLDCVIDDYHWYNFDKCKEFAQKNDIDTFKEMLVNNDKCYLTIVKFHC